MPNWIRKLAAEDDAARASCKPEPFDWSLVAAFFKALWPSPIEWVILLLIAIAGSLGII